MRWAAAAAIAMGMGITSPVHALPNSSNLAPAGTATATSAAFGSSIGTRSTVTATATSATARSTTGAGAAGALLPGRPGSRCLHRTRADSPPHRRQRRRLRQHAAHDLQGRRRRQSRRRGVHAGLRHDFVRVGTWGTTDPGGSAPGGAFGRHVRLERLDNNYWLTFAEFEVIGSTTPLKFTETDNLAAGKP